MFEKVLKYRVVSSTQDIARRFAHQNRAIAITALSQRRGRGRSSRVWFSPPGGLYLSLVVYPDSHRNAIPLLASLVVIKVVEEYGLSGLTIHWPNDVLIRGRKICGILCEEVGRSVICGIGLNVNNASFPKKLDDATSMKMETGSVFNLDDVGESIMHRFERLFPVIRNQRSISRFVGRYVAGIGEAVEVITSARKYSGTVFGIDDDWGLMLRDESGMIKKFYHGDVRRLQW